MCSARYDRRPPPLMKARKPVRQCQWVGEISRKQCPEPATGYYFCEHHARIAAKIDACAFAEYEFGEGIKV